MLTKNILFAMTVDSSNKLEENILNYYKNKYNCEFTYKKEYYLQGILKALNEEEYDILILNSQLEKETVDAAFIDAITDNHATRIILVVDEITNSKNLLKSLYTMGVYDCVFKSDFKYDTIVDLIHTPRKKKEAKLYYELDDILNNIDDVLKKTELIEIPADELDTVLENLNSASESNIRELFGLAEQTYSFQQIVFLISLLDDSVIELMKSNNCKVDKYIKHLEKEATKQAFNEKVNKIQKVVEEKIVEKVIEKEKIVKVPVEVQKVIEKEKIVEVPVEVEKIVEVYNTPNDYKKVIGFLNGSRKSGTTTIIDLVCSELSANGTKVAVLELGRYRDLYERHIFSSNYEDNPLHLLKNGVNRPFAINKNYSLYTSVPNDDIKLDTSTILKMIDVVKQTHDLIILNIDKEIIGSIFSILDKLILVTTPVITDFKYTTECISSILESDPLISLENKLHFLINKYIESSKILKPKDICNCLKYKVIDYTDTDKNIQLLKGEISYSTVSFNEEVVVNGYKENYLDIPLELKEDIRLFSNVLYPSSSVRKEKKGFMNSILKRKRK